ncbi:histidine kinase [Terrimonas alba]|uniref:histidine kinase n=1 Tax=Terrimonas alba TaxID=3349636 RepID=UPI0035F3C395
MHCRLFIFFVLLASTAQTQTHKIDSIRKNLSTLNDREAVNSLNALGWQFFYYWIHSDSALKYANLARQKASAINYSSGMAEALLIEGGVKGRLLGHPDVMERDTRKAIELLKNETNSEVFSMAYYSLAMSLAIVGKYDAANEAVKKAIAYATTANDQLSLGWAKQAAGFSYSKSGEYWKSFENLIEAVEIGKQQNDTMLISFSLAFIGRAFNRVGDPSKALHYYYQALQYECPFVFIWPHAEDMAYAHLVLKQYDSVTWYQQKYRADINLYTTDPAVRKKFGAYVYGFSMELQLARKQYDTLLVQVLPRLPVLRKNNDVFPLMVNLLVVAKAYLGKSNYQTALGYARELNQTAYHAGNKQFQKDGYELLASVYDHLKKTDSAYHYFKRFTFIKDSMEIALYSGRTALYVAASDAENKIRLLKKDKELGDQQLRLNKKELQKQAQLKNLLIAGSIALLLISVLIVRNNILKRKNEQLLNNHAQSRLKRKAMELEMQALRAQMNPHFIFNCLSAIDNLIQTKQSDKATSYLARFAKLIRSVLDSSKNNLVPFQMDLETIQLYLEMEKFRCNDKFNYEINVEPVLLHGDFKVPPLIVQPFLENAIHHGLLNKKENDRQLQLKINLCDEFVVYSILDNGIGREKAAELKERNRPEHQSYGIAITRERIHLHNQNGIDDDLVITDLEKEGILPGTKAVIRINCSKS